MNDQRQVIFSQRLKILKNVDVSDILENFFEEQIQFLIGKKEIFNKSNDKQEYLTNLKNLTGNAFNDETLLSFATLGDKEFTSKLKDSYILKKKERIRIIGENQNSDLEKKIFLQIIDFSWRSHLQYLEQLRQVIGLRSYGQKDPLSEFKKEAFILFEELLNKIKIEIIKFLFNLNIVIKKEEKEEKSETNKVKSSQKIGRNEKCPCGSGKKFKHCCGTV